MGELGLDLKNEIYKITINSTIVTNTNTNTNFTNMIPG